MSLIRKILWYVERHLDQALSLSDIARHAGVGRFHATRLFAYATGWPLMAYVRARRLSTAAKALTTVPDILTVAVASGYGSHEAFSRAFRAEFGLQPKALRQSGNLAQMTLTEPLIVTEVQPLPVQTPRHVKASAMTFAGLNEHYNKDNLTGIPALWQRFHPYYGQIDGQKGGLAYGISHNFSDLNAFDYLAAVEVEGDADLPKGFTRLKVAAHAYAVFEHRGHVSGITNTWRHIYEHWIPASGIRPIQAPCFERMDERFDGRTGNGIIEIWIPVA
ncbi:hypothetical protein ABAC460_07760 [Asticcacaulis sp. AC460]|uniref:AraC family transcriptional regulator n=1 Tax=Asticcacaulis sp. AC460 TaxID=1282360 RepID=UPI0003C40911|nr:AraC family transcriptional regulator [Asticcacaulis sp. AC460]ESQ90716.1 hypothetical protein ABAC460_07760 [Asticcacaulis sp. AC460]